MRLNFLPILLLVLIGILAGCQEGSSSNESKEAASAAEDREAKDIKINEAPENVTSPSDAAIHQYEVSFKNGEKAFPETSSIITETTLGNHSIVAIRSPEGKNKYTVFLYENKNEWIMNGFMRLGVAEENSFTGNGLNLPMKKFSSSNIELADKNQEAWAFVDEEKIITIARFNQLSFEENPETKIISLNNGYEAFISKDKFKNSFLYYFDTEKTVVVSGNVKEK
ncbi:MULTISPECIES: hypothetical protein [Bacillus]|uniref:Lipoprotein n=1 Tax=Bacillus capparidis TaxID=1840411 RepID=A0ABS4CXK6_9BACI|nr:MULTISPECIES: hypothetical protein [Bacillus]MBP1082076.1 hypothetical protein [Bacillus capparidis]MED1096701.1 hypothetical protein [Bacillus capparidis]